MEAVVKFTNQSQGRDRVFRTTQYACSLLIYLLRNKSEGRDLVAKLQQLETNMRAGRKLFRLGNAVNSIVAAKQTVHLPDRVLRLCLTVANFSRALYFLCDNVVWARGVGLVRNIDKERWSVNASRFYFYSLVMHLTRDAYVIFLLMVKKSRDEQFKHKLNQHVNESCDVAEAVIPELDTFVFLLLETLKSHPAVALDTVKNICDLFIPLDRLGFYKTNAGVVGFCGLMSSLMGIVTLAHPALRIKP
ncbi:peroxisomal membrane protein 11A [Nothobranchius furzeri]|uniref:Peroxisomal biogenesis factor 11 alpha n=2 Tax=Nothobranchius TaxID=28779 RepID=A0A1A8ULP4_NOTFU|nr:peroxisomal membrane protein 11A [Nothobranchius furzeri]KAF7224472.1 peroxisomal membrane protein 11A-like [Nothobranchius furzeri]